MNSAPAVFDPQKFEWLNGQYIHAMSAAALRPLVVNAIRSMRRGSKKAIDVVKTSVHLLPQFAEALRFVREYTPPEIDRAFAAARCRTTCATNGAPVDADAVKAMNERLKTATGLKGKDAVHAAAAGDDRHAITGRSWCARFRCWSAPAKSDPRVLSPLARVEQCIR